MHQTGLIYKEKDKDKMEVIKNIIYDDKDKEIGDKENNL